MRKRRLTKEDIEPQVSALTPGKGIEAKFYNTHGTVVVTFACSKGEDGLITRTFTIGRKSAQGGKSVDNPPMPPNQIS